MNNFAEFFSGSLLRRLAEHANSSANMSAAANSSDDAPGSEDESSNDVSSTPKDSGSPAHSSSAHSVHMAYLAQLIENNPSLGTASSCSLPSSSLSVPCLTNSQPPKRKGRSLAETIEILKQKKSKKAKRDDDESTVESNSEQPSSSGASPSLPLFILDAVESPMVDTIHTQEREIKNRIKALTNQIPLDSLCGEDDKRFRCQICQKRFANKFLLNKHIFIHTGLRPHQCPDCQKSFNRKDNLLRHRKTHLLGYKDNMPELVAPSTGVDIHSNSPESLILRLFANH